MCRNVCFFIKSNKNQTENTLKCFSCRKRRCPRDTARRPSRWLTFDPTPAMTTRGGSNSTLLRSNLLPPVLQDALIVPAPSCRRPVLPKQVPITAGLPAQGPGRARQRDGERAGERLELIRTIWPRVGPRFIPERPNVSHSWRGRRRLIKQGSGNNELRGAAGGDGERARERGGRSGGSTVK